ncbi:hypothetical protein LCGC14_2380780 [marine sediment metagenome]|uniref:Uncharacterized protein n=1 Tax=marine sediment metagenome TaxID=412755 RepID=A0A0F9EVS3_9ZZZZ
MPSRERTLAAALEACKVIEDDENVHSRQQRQLELLATEVIYLLIQVRELQE